MNALERLTVAAREGHPLDREDVLVLIVDHTALLDAARAVIAAHTDPDTVTRASTIRSLKNAVADCERSDR